MITYPQLIRSSAIIFAFSILLPMQGCMTAMLYSEAFSGETRSAVISSVNNASMDTSGNLIVNLTAREECGKNEWKSRDYNFCLNLNDFPENPKNVKKDKNRNIYNSPKLVDYYLSDNNCTILKFDHHKLKKGNNKSMDPKCILPVCSTSNNCINKGEIDEKKYEKQIAVNYYPQTDQLSPFGPYYQIRFFNREYYPQWGLSLLLPVALALDIVLFPVELIVGIVVLTQL